jgi:ATP-binding cassette subfamily F protein 3
LAKIEELLASPEIYSEQNKADLKKQLAQQAETKQATETAEELWLDAQDQLEQAQQRFDESVES